MDPNKEIKYSSVESSVCLHCQSLVDLKSDNYIAFHGNVLVGSTGGLIGNNFGSDGRLKNVSIFCNKPECFLSSLQYSSPDHNIKSFWVEVKKAAEKMIAENELRYSHLTDKSII